MKRVAAIAGVALGLMAGGANAALYSRGNGMVYDDVLKITWGPGFGGTWTNVNAWANNLVYGGYDDWRLPALSNPNVNGPCGPLGQCSEMAYMYYKNYGKVVGWNSIYGSGPQAPLPPNAENWALFPMLGNHWSVLFSPFEPATGVEAKAYYFDFNLGVPGTEYEYKYRDVSAAVAVRDGDVPEPSTVALLSLSLGAMAWAARRKQA
jgi:hypothetical protein